MLRALSMLLILAGCAGNPARFSRHPETALRQADDLTCFRMTWGKREELLSLADPENFPGVRYRKGSSRPIERETDCSRFVHEIYRRAGLPYGFRSTRDLKQAPEFREIPVFAARPGDLMLFRGHVGIVDLDGLVISATKVRTRRQSSSITRMHPDSFGRRRAVLRYTCPRELQAGTP
ncbi:MAG: C40 family peptidase [Bdellovibrionales bacterium]|nr:C40 family peptidase [Bdellovibrionales bacterium]